MSAGLPSWRALLAALVNDVRDHAPDRHELEALDPMLEAGRLLEVAEYCKRALPPARFGQLLREQLQTDVDLPEHFRIIASLPFAGIVTTNYDNLFERAFAEAGMGNVQAPTHADKAGLGTLLFDEAPTFVLKAHGDVQRPESIVLAARDYRELVHTNRAFSDLFSAILMSHAVLFVGYSLNDPDFQMLLDRQLTTFGGYVPQRFALMSGLTQIERELLYNTAQIRVLPYPDGEHEQVLHFLRKCLELVGDATTQEREPNSIPKVTATAAGHQRSVIDLAVPGQAELQISWAGGRLTAELSGPGDDAISGTGRRADLGEIARAVGAALHLAEPDGINGLGVKLAGVLPPGVVEAVEQLPDEQVITLHVGADLASIPWELLGLAGRSLACRPICRASARTTSMARGAPTIGGERRVLLIGDTGGPLAPELPPLPGARREIEQIAALYDGGSNVVTVLLGGDATYDAIVRELGAHWYDVVHFAGHGYFEHEAFLSLAGGERLFASDLRAMLRPKPPAIVFLNSHFTSLVPAGVSVGTSPGDERGAPGEGAATPTPWEGREAFSETVLAAGAGAMVGTFTGGLDDFVAERVGLAFHTRLLAGDTVARALQLARLEVLDSAGDDPQRQAGALLYSLAGSPGLRIVTSTASS